LTNLIGGFPDHPLIVEFRHTSWQVEAVHRGMGERGVTCCACDMPELGKLPRFTPVLTGSNAYTRFHGRNARNWYGANARDRHDYLHSDGGLATHTPVPKGIPRKSQTLRVFFNNHAKGNAAMNAQKMMVLMAEV
jgi:uncharacterized protein YecE (DUF72 family)